VQFHAEVSRPVQERAQRNPGERSASLGGQGQDREAVFVPTTRAVATEGALPI